MGKLRVGMVGTSWWADSMYAPALQNLPNGALTIVCGRDPGRAEEFGRRWNAEHTTSWSELIDRCDAVIVATPNDMHEAIAIAAMDAGRHVLVEKPLALNVEGANNIVAAAARSGVITLVPFTYRWMPIFQWTKKLIDDGFVGRVHSVNLRYHSGYALGSEYAWRFDPNVSGSGILGDLGSHFVHVARWWCGEINSVSAHAFTEVPRDPRPDGTQYDHAEDSGIITMRFVNGGYGIVHVSATAYEGDAIGQTHAAEIHGSDGTLHVYSDWDRVQEVRGLRTGEKGRPYVLPIPESIWGTVRRDTVHNTYRDVFRTTNVMTREWLTAAAQNRHVQPDVTEGARVQAIIDAAIRSSATGGTSISI